MSSSISTKRLLSLFYTNLTMNLQANTSIFRQATGGDRRPAPEALALLERGSSRASMLIQVDKRGWDSLWRGVGLGLPCDEQ